MHTIAFKTGIAIGVCTINDYWCKKCSVIVSSILTDCITCFCIGSCYSNIKVIHYTCTVVNIDTSYLRITSLVSLYAVPIVNAEYNNYNIVVNINFTGYSVTNHITPLSTI